MSYKNKSYLAWAIELLWQCFFFAIPAIFDVPAFIDWFTITYHGGDYKDFVGWSFVYAMNLGWIIPNFFYMLLYIFQIPFFEQYRCQDWVWNKPQSKRRTQYLEVLKSTIISFFVNQTIMSFGILQLSQFAMRHEPNQDAVRDWLVTMPAFWVSTVKIIISLALFETAFYWLHVWLHSPTGYRFHKDHHAYYTPISLAGQWGSVVDGLVSLPIPAFVPVFIVGMHPASIWLYAIAQTAHSSYDHCGYDFPVNPFQLIPLASHVEAHNFHHSHSVDNFGLFWRFWDNIMGTNQHWERFSAKRDVLFEKLKRGEKADDDEDYVIRDGVMLLRCVAEEEHIAKGEDNLSYTFQFINKNVDEQGNLIVPVMPVVPVDANIKSKSD